MAFERKTGPGAPTPSAQRPDLNTLFRPSTELETVRGLKLGIYGKAKSGKTHFALTAPDPRYVVDTEGSVRLNVLAFPKEHQEKTFVSEVIHYADIKTRKVDLSQSLFACFDAIDALTAMIIEKEEDPEFKPGTIIIDSATDIWQWLTMWLEDTTGKTSLTPGGMPRFEWGKANRKYTEFMYMLMRSSWNVIFTFRAQEAIGKGGENLGYDVPRWQKNTPYWLDMNTEIVWDGTSTLLTFQGDRFGRVQGTLRNATWDDVIAAIRKKTGVTFL